MVEKTLGVMEYQVGMLSEDIGQKLEFNVLSATSIRSNQLALNTSLYLYSAQQQLSGLREIENSKAVFASRIW